MVFYFTGTGNSLYVAKNISLGINETLISIPKAVNNNEFLYKLGKGENIGFVYPVHGWRPPKLVIEFIKKLKFENYHDNYVYSIFTCAGQFEATAEVLNSALKKINLLIKGNYCILMPGNYVFAENKIPLEEEERRIREAQYEVNKIVNEIKNQNSNYVKHKHSFIKSYIIGGILLPLSPRTTKFNVNSKCTNCGLCVKGCPVNALKIHEGKIKREGKNCVLCMKCINCCPKESIDFGNKTIGKRRYKHPEYKMTNV